MWWIRRLMLFPATALKAHALALGFNLIGLTPAVPSPRLDAYLRWLEGGLHGTMSYLARPDRLARRRDLNAILPGARSLIIVGLDYHALNVPAALLTDPARGRIAAYAWGLDYHDLMTPRLEALAGWLRRESGREIAHRVYVDTGALLERSHAQAAGLGFIGKNTLLIHPRRGSYFFLGELLTDLPFDSYDMPHAETMCGTCNRCRAACPTAAFPAPYVLDARRCISYLTIEHKGWIDPALRPLMGNWVMGCDICQEVCPFTRFAQPTGESALLPVSPERAAPPLLDLLRLDENNFRTRFEGSPIMRLKRDRLVRNACIAAGNWGSALAVPTLNDLLHDPSALVRGHAAWALGRILKTAALPALEAALGVETDPEAASDIKQTLDIVGKNHTL
jgi:epoxyqueuosine reductase